MGRWASSRIDDLTRMRGGSVAIGMGPFPTSLCRCCGVASTCSLIDSRIPSIAGLPRPCQWRQWPRNPRPMGGAAAAPRCSGPS
eukprot:2454772-Pyramimonas_sp.AAC.1